MIVGYARESTTKEEQDQALAWQVERLERYGCERVFVDRKSGASRNRPAYNEMLELLKAGQVTKLVACNLTRVGRSRRMVEDLIDLCLEKNVVFVSLDGSVDLSTAAGRAAVALQSVFGQLERELIAERIKAGYEGIRDKKQPIHAPFGYCIVERQLQIDPELEPIAKWLRQIAVRDGLIKAAQAINEKYPGLPKVPRTPAGIKHWLQCPTIYGHLRYNSRADHEQRKQSKTPESALSKQKLGSPIIYLHNHPALFSEFERQEAEEAFKKRHRPGFNADPVRFPLSGLVVCGCCGNRMQVSYKKNRPFGPTTTYYRCIYWLRRICSNSKYVSVARLQDAVIAALIERSDAIANRAVQPSEPPSENPKLIELRNQLAALRKMPQNPHIKTAITGIESDIALLELTRLDGTLSTPMTPERQQALNACKDHAFWQEIAPESKPAIYKLLIKQIRWDGDDIAVELWV